MATNTVTIDLAALRSAAERVHAHLAPTPQIVWPIISEAVGCEVWVKHENHLPTGSFKVRGGLIYMEHLRKTSQVQQVIAATRGNHGQSVAYAARQYGFHAAIVVPHGNSTSKNAAMRAYGAELIEHGRDFVESYEHMQKLAAESGAHPVPSFDTLLVQGIASYGLELFDAAGELDAVYVPIGWGSGICSVISARDALGLKTRIIGVVAEKANSFALSFEAGKVVETGLPQTMADGMAIRRPHPDGLAWAMRGTERIVLVSEQEILAAIKLYFEGTHNVAEGAGAAALAAALRDAYEKKFRRVGVVLSGGNIDAGVFGEALAH